MRPCAVLLVLAACVTLGTTESLFTKHYRKRDHSDQTSPCYTPTFASVPRLGNLGTAPVLLVPGIGGSSLWGQDVEDGPLDHVWATTFSADCAHIDVPHKWETPPRCRSTCECVIPEHLFSKYNATSGFTESVGRFRITPAYDGYGLCGISNLGPDLPLAWKANMFHDMIIHLRSYGYTPGDTLWGLPYDWRQSNTEPYTLELFRDLVAYLHASTGKKVVIISHSMGGLKTLSLLEKYPQNFSDNVQAWIAIAAPFQGAPSTYNSFVQGYNLGNEVPLLGGLGLSNTTAHQMVMQFPSVYDLLPNPSFPWDETPTLSFYMRGVANPLRYTVSNAESVLENINGLNEVTYAFDGKYDKYWNNWQVPLFSRAMDNKNRWSSLRYTGTPFTFVNIAGEGLDTPHSFSYTFEGRLLDSWGTQPEIYYTSGDSTVPLESAQGDGAIRAIIPSSFYHRHTVTQLSDHVDIVKTEETFSIIDEYLAQFN